MRRLLILVALLLAGCAPDPNKHKYDRYCGLYHGGIQSIGTLYRIERREGAKVYHTELYLVQDVTCRDGHRWAEWVQDLGRL